jgi:apolipoprotein N-acyltransferase
MALPFSPPVIGITCPVKLSTFFPCDNEVSSMPSLASPDLEPHSIETASLAQRLPRHRVIAGVVSGLALWMSFPPVAWSGLAWIALVPLFWLVILKGSPWKSYLAAWCGGLVFWLLAVEWVRMSDPSAWLGWLLMAFFFSLWWPGFLGLARWAIFRLQIPLLLAAPVIWVGLEYVRAYVLTGFPWYYLAHSQFRQIYLIQVADLTGSLGISLLIAIVNAMVVDLLTLPLFYTTRAGTRLRPRQHVRLCLVTILVGTTLCYGAFRVSTAVFRDGPKLALLQSNIEQRHKVKGDPAAIKTKLMGLVERALAHNERPDLIVWPETAYPYRYIAIDPSVDAETLENQVRSISAKITPAEWLKVQAVVADDLHDLTAKANVPMLVGSIYYHHRKPSFEKYNSALLLRPGFSGIDFYHKMHLVPFGEYVPFIETLPWLSILTPYHGQRVPSLSFGHDPRCLRLGNYVLAVTICFEDTVPQVIARFFPSDGNDGAPDVLINLSNDGWFHGSAELDMHLANGVFRAVEHRVPVTRAVNTGLTALIDGNGEIRAALPKESDGVLSVTVPLDDRRSPYSRLGDWLGLSCLAVTVGLVPIGIIGIPGRFRPQN